MEKYLTPCSLPPSSPSVLNHFKYATHSEAPQNHGGGSRSLGSTNGTPCSHPGLEGDGMQVPPIPEHPCASLSIAAHPCVLEFAGRARRGWCR